MLHSREAGTLFSNMGLPVFYHEKLFLNHFHVLEVLHIEMGIVLHHVLAEVSGQSLQLTVWHTGSEHGIERVPPRMKAEVPRLSFFLTDPNLVESSIEGFRHGLMVNRGLPPIVGEDEAAWIDFLQWL